MGQAHKSPQHFTTEELWDYQALTFLTTMEIQNVHQKFLNLASEVADNKELYLTSEQVRSIPAIKLNPFGDQICKVFSRNEEGLFSFDDFLEMMSVFSENASLSVKTDYAFQIYDLNGNNYIDQEDIRDIILRLTNRMMDEINILALTHYILDEGDLNNDGMLSFAEFENIINRAPDFQKVNQFQKMLWSEICIQPANRDTLAQCYRIKWKKDPLRYVSE